MIRNNWPETITEREIGAHVAQHLREQGRRAMGHDGVCRYRIPSMPGVACAVGCLLTDEEAEELRDNPSIDTLKRYAADDPRGIKRLPERLRPHVRLLNQLQLRHDQASRYGTSAASLGPCLELADAVARAPQEIPAL